ncbi:unnamed protein product [Clonostachys rosea]|uniref:HNH nuclease domain-containing protein n=1 Tax=Bionectria ochroleuca TaxID=29856 RepID=A0ABY6U7H7_BIOOC|nr:unnamed protein product [Clonostachys rosea]
MASTSSQNRSLSINQVIRQNPRDQLFVQPLKWTHEHLSHLDISFLEPKELHPLDQLHRGSKLNDIVKDEEHEEFRDLTDWVESLLKKADNLLLYEQDLYLNFHNRKQELNCMFCFEPGENIPLAATVDHETIVKERQWTVESKLKTKSTTTSIEIGKSKSALKMKKITPDDSSRDPVVAATLIALAQAQQRAMVVASRPHTEEVDVDPEVLKPFATDGRKYEVRLLVGFRNDLRFMLYKAVISSAFLAKFNDLDYAPPTPTSMEIEISDIPFRPHISLHRRIFNELLPDREGTGGDSDERSTVDSETPSEYKYRVSKDSNGPST